MTLIYMRLLTVSNCLVLRFLLATFLTMGYLEASSSDDIYSDLRLPNQTSVSLSLDQKIQSICHKILEKTTFISAGTALGSASVLTRLGGGLCLLSPWTSKFGNECLLLSNVLGCAAHHAFAYLLKGSPSPAFQNVPLSQQSWYLNQMLLSKVPRFSPKEQQLLGFLEKRWLAKSSGFYASMVDWICPCFGIFVQVDPEATGFYARNPGNKFSPPYTQRIEDWKKSLLQPQGFPLLLTRPFDLQNHLPNCLALSASEETPKMIEQLLKISKATQAQVVVDVSVLFEECVKNREQWLLTWNDFQLEFTRACKDRDINLKQIVCIQHMQQEEIGGIRILPLQGQSDEDIEQLHRFLLEWISLFGLSANRIELDRWPLSSSKSPMHTSNSLQANNTSLMQFNPYSKEEFLSYLAAFEHTWHSDQPQEMLMIKGTLQILKGLLTRLSEEHWNQIVHSPTYSMIVYLSFIKIKHQLESLIHKKKSTSFFTLASHIEQIHADYSTLLETLSPFTSEDFPSIYQDLLTRIPSNLRQLTSCGLHASGMTSLAGIFKAVEKSIGKAPRVLYGENAYFENIQAANLVSNASSIDGIISDWNQIDLLLAQFHPALKRIDFRVTEYRIERIADVLHKCLNTEREKPLTLAIDCTFDFIDSSHVGDLLVEFQKEIEQGILNVICYRSGLKFDLFGMDNYCGAPFFMIHNEETKWASFDSLLTDPVLQTDRLSLNWFCVAYQNAAPQLELYRKQVFDNTRAFLNKLPSRLLHANQADYRIIPMEEGANLAFIDIKVFGSFHAIRTSLLVGGGLTIHCMQAGHPIFYRPSVGFYHPNFTVLFGEECSTIRLTLGLDPAQVDILANFFAKIDVLNGPPAKLTALPVYQLVNDLCISDKKF